MNAIVLKLMDSFTDEQFFELCRINDELRIERDANKNMIIMEPTGLETGGLNSDINTELNIWNRKEKKGKVFDSSSGVTLKDGSIRSPDAMWIALEKWKALPKSERKKFAFVTPDFVLEIRSETDTLKELKEKMVSYIKNDIRLAWLVDPQKEKIYVYREDGSVDEWNGFDTVLSGEEVMKGLTMRLSDFIDDEDE